MTNFITGFVGMLLVFLGFFMLMQLNILILSVIIIITGLVVLNIDEFMQVIKLRKAKK